MDESIQRICLELHKSIKNSDYLKLNLYMQSLIPNTHIRAYTKQFIWQIKYADQRKELAKKFCQEALWEDMSFSLFTFWYVSRRI